jgi:nucleoside 2-deoxyribosyltransferase
MVMTNGLKPEEKPLLSAYCRRLPEGSKPPTITTVTTEQFINALPKYTPPEKLDNLLELMGRMSPGLGKETTFEPERDYPLLISPGPEEVLFLLAELSKRGYVESPFHHSRLTLAGWERLEQIKETGRLSNRAFVAMWFHESTNAIYEDGIQPAIREAGYDPLRIDRHEHVNRIDDEIIAQIKRSRFMVADFTGQRYGVYFEAGMMIGLGRTVIWLCDKEDLDEGKLHFDVRQFNFIAYESIEDAKMRLYNRILAIEGEGPGQFEKPE